MSFQTLLVLNRDIITYTSNKKWRMSIMKKIFIVGVCVLAFTNFLFLTLATTDLLSQAGCGASTAASCHMGASSFVWQFSRTPAPSVMPAVAQLKTVVVMLGHSARMVSRATRNQIVVLWGAVHLSNRFCARSPRRDTFGQVILHEMTPPDGFRKLTPEIKKRQAGKSQLR